MSETATFQCPNCGSPVKPNGAQKQVKCEYCGSTVIVPEELRDQPAPVSSSTPIEINFGTFTPAINNEAMENLSKAAKVTAGATAVSIILPIALTCIILGFVGAVLFFTFSSMNKTISSVAAFPTNLFSTLAPNLVSDTATPTDIPTPFNTPASFQKVLLKDNFTNPNSGWNTTRSADYTLEYSNGKYHVLVNKENGGHVVWVGDQYTNMSVEVDAQQTAGPDDGRIGVACRPNDSGGFYAFEFTQGGQYGIYKFTDWDSEPLAEGQLDPDTISTTSPVHLEGVCDGSALTLLLNNQALLQAEDSDYTTGGMGLVVTTGDSGQPGVDVLFSNLVVKGP